MGKKIYANNCKIYESRNGKTYAFLITKHRNLLRPSSVRCQSFGMQNTISKPKMEAFSKLKKKKERIKFPSNISETWGHCL